MSFIGFFLNVIHLSSDSFSVKKQRVKHHPNLKFRFMKEDDCQRASELLLHGFRSKIEYTTGKENLDTTLKKYRDNLMSDKNLRERHLLAIVNNEVKGMCQIKTYKS